MPMGYRYANIDLSKKYKLVLYMFYINRIPEFLRRFLPGDVWEISSEEPTLYLSFDDGPHPQITGFVLDELRKWNAKATFFCIGKNVKQYPEMYRQILEEGHSVGNHTMHHLNAWSVKEEVYLEDVAEAKTYIDSDLFRPPYGKITRFLQKRLAAPAYGMKTIMWSLLSADFDAKVSPEKCLNNVVLRAKSGDIIVFHDSEKAKEKIEFALPRTLQYFNEKGYAFKRIEMKRKNFSKKVGPG